MENREAQETNGQTKKPTSGAELRAKSRPLVTCPSGNTYRLRKPDIAALINSGALPENFTGKLLSKLDKKETDVEGDNDPLKDEDLLSMAAIKRATVTAAMLEPRIVANAVNDDEIEFQDVPKEDREYIYLWATRGLPEVPIEIAKGETTVEAVENFPTEEPSVESIGIGTDSREIGNTSVSTAGNQG